MTKSSIADVFSNEIIISYLIYNTYKQQGIEFVNSFTYDTNSLKWLFK